MKLIDNWQYLILHLDTVRWSALWSTIVTVWLLTPEADRQKLLALMPFDIGAQAPAIAILLAFIGNVLFRLRHQPTLHTQPPAAPPAVPPAP